MFLLSTPFQKAFGKQVPSKGRSKPRKKRDPVNKDNTGNSHGNPPFRGRGKEIPGRPGSSLGSSQSTWKGGARHSESSHATRGFGDMPVTNKTELINTR